MILSPTAGVSQVATPAPALEPGPVATATAQPPAAPATVTPTPAPPSEAATGPAPTPNRGGPGATLPRIPASASNQDANPTPVAESVLPTAVPFRVSPLGISAAVPDGFNDPSAGYLLLNQRWVEGLYTIDLDLSKPEEVFWYIFSRLPDQVTVYPSENYFYFIIYVNGRQLWGNIRLPTGQREFGLLSFAYFEFVEFSNFPGSRTSQAKFFSQEDGLEIGQVDHFTHIVKYRGKAVTFNLHKLKQEPPSSFPLGDDELFIQRTFDESGYQFFLLFNEARNYFFWVLNEEEIFTDYFEPFDASDETMNDLIVGKRSGFAFWIDREHAERKVLVGIRRLSVTRNDYYDGPFDQLADNYADETNVSEYMQRALPGVRGRIDKYGYYMDRAQPVRVALSNYFTYFSRSDLKRFFDGAMAADDPYEYISRRGRPAPTGPTPTPHSITPTATPVRSGGGS